MLKNNISIAAVDPSKTIPLKELLEVLSFQILKKIQSSTDREKETLFSINKKNFNKTFSNIFSKILKKEKEKQICTDFLYNNLQLYKCFLKEPDKNSKKDAISYVKQFLNKNLPTKNSNKKSLFYIKNNLHIKKIIDGISVSCLKTNTTFEINYRTNQIKKNNNKITQIEFIEYSLLIINNVQLYIKTKKRVK